LGEGEVVDALCEVASEQLKLIIAFGFGGFGLG